MTALRAASWHDLVTTRLEARVPLVNGAAWVVALIGAGLAARYGPYGWGTALFVVAALGCRHYLRRPWVVYPLAAGTLAAALGSSAYGSLALYVIVPVFLGWRYAAEQWQSFLSPATAVAAALFVGWAGPSYGGHADVVWVIVAGTVVGSVAGVAVGALERSHSLEAETTVLRGRTEASERQTHWLAERTALARELHDVVGHHVTAMVVQAEAGKVGDPHTALSSVADLGRQALGELDALVVHLRDPQARLSTSALPRLGDVDPVLAAPLRGQGVDVRVRVDEDVALDDAGTLVAYRIVQEALTNISRHAHARTAWVEVTRAGRNVRIRVSDDGAGPPPAAEHGCGLLGVEERVSGRGGIWAISERPGGGTSVDVFLPADDE